MWCAHRQRTQEPDISAFYSERGRHIGYDTGLGQSLHCSALFTLDCKEVQTDKDCAWKEAFKALREDHTRAPFCLLDKYILRVLIRNIRKGICPIFWLGENRLKRWWQGSKTLVLKGFVPTTTTLTIPLHVRPCVWARRRFYAICLWKMVQTSICSSRAETRGRTSSH